MPPDPIAALADVRWMRRAVRLASLSLGCTWPNPPVGCVLVKDGHEIGAGRHRVRGREHAETAALADCRVRGHDPSGATAYVTLAPCTRRGRQPAPPCAESLIRAGVARVVVAVADPHQDSAAERFADAGIRYEDGVCAELGAQLVGGFLSRVTSGCPRFTGKWAMSLDGRISGVAGAGTTISSPEAIARSRRRRRAFDGILIGVGTALADDPQLLAVPPRWRIDLAGEREDQTGTPVRIVVSANARLPPTSRLVTSIDCAPLWLLHHPSAAAERLRSLERSGVRLLPVVDPHQPAQVAMALGQAGLNEVLVEGGATIHRAFLRAGLYQRIECYVGALTFSGGVGVIPDDAALSVPSGQAWHLEQPPRLFGDTTLIVVARATTR